MPLKSRAPAKLTAAQLAELNVIDLCSNSSEDEVDVEDPHAALEPLVEPLRHHRAQNRLGSRFCPD